MKYSFCYYLLNIPKTPYMYDVKQCGGLLQIVPSYSIFQYQKDHDIFHYNTKYRRQFKNKYFKPYYVDNHHIIPKQFHNHPLIQEIGFDVACSKNILFLPNSFAKSIFKKDDFLYHSSHPKYNTFVHKELQRISSQSTTDMKQYAFVLFFTYLRDSIMKKDPSMKKFFLH